MQTKTISPAVLWGAPSWSPAYFVGPAAVALEAGRGGKTLAELSGEVLEGWRVSETPGTASYDPRAAETPIYRQSHLEAFRLAPASTHWETPRLQGRWCVQPGDVLVSKFPPVRAALVSASARRHPVDGNTLIVRGLAWPEAVWLAACLNRTEYGELLLVGSGLLRRVNLGALAELRVPPAPAGMGTLSAELGELLEERHAAGEALFWAKREVAAAVGVPPEPHDLRAGLFVASEALTVERWLPAAVALRAEQSTLAGELGWAPLRILGTAEARSRLLDAPEGARALRLGDVGEDLFVYTEGNDALPSELPLDRLLGRPLTAGEVLLSTLGTSFRVAYVDEGVPPRVFPIDGWVRMRFRETPAAWTLLLASPRVNRQTAGLATGSVLQFIPPAVLLSLHLPVPDREARDRWQAAVERHHSRRRALDTRWSTLMTSLTAAFESVHPPLRARTEREAEEHP